jgi:hypothetical protein
VKLKESENGLVSNENKNKEVMMRNFKAIKNIIEAYSYDVGYKSSRY